mmetsp:Transcript_20083/g.34581  ORF Transcript_20083/g.34581 Transcript_20083/m.34581 type:complete len:228 (-) Transcript_20083:961-1644(-)
MDEQFGPVPLQTQNQHRLSRIQYLHSASQRISQYSITSSVLLSRALRSHLLGTQSSDFKSLNEYGKEIVVDSSMGIQVQPMVRRMFCTGCFGFMGDVCMSTAVVEKVGSNKKGGRRSSRGSKKGRIHKTRNTEGKRDKEKEKGELKLVLVCKFCKSRNTIGRAFQEQVIPGKELARTTPTNAQSKSGGKKDILSSQKKLTPSGAIKPSGSMLTPSNNLQKSFLFSPM